MKFFHAMTTTRWSVVLLLGLMLVSSAFTLVPQPPEAPSESFFVASKEGRISPRTQATLLKFYQAIYGKNARPKTIELVPFKGQHYVAWQGTGADVPTLTVQLKATKQGFVITAASKKNTCSGDPCNACSFKKGTGCSCAGTGFCNHVGTGVVGDLTNPAQVLGIGL